MPSASAPLTIVHAVFSSRLAGGERHCIDLAQAQAEQGHDVHIVGPRVSRIADAVGPTVRYHGLALPVARGARFRLLARRLRADICHGHLGPACKAVATVTDTVRIGTLHVGYKRHHHARMDGLICVNAAQAQRLGDYAGAACTIYNWAPRVVASPASDLRAELGLDPRQLLVGSVGRLNAAKGMDVLVAAFRASAPRDAVLAILGEGKEMARLQALADGDPRIRLLGFRRDVDAALGAMDLFVSPSREEAFPLAVLEALRAGLPIVSTATQGPLEMLAGTPARIVPIDDVEAMGAALRDGLDGLRATPHDEREPIAYDLSAYDRDTAVRRAVAFYRQALARSAGEVTTTHQAHMTIGHV